MLTIRAMSNGQGYSARHLEYSDYYAEGERVAGYWQGRGAELLGLAGEVESRQFEALRQGYDPANGEFLRQRQSADRVAADGTTQSKGRNLYDFTFSAPKSVSILAALGEDPRLIEAHQKAVGEALRELESQAATRVRQNGANEDRTTGNLILAVYHHDTSRELDPQLHTHAVAANLTYDGWEARWKALQASAIYDRRAYLTEVYRNALAREVRDLGYEIETRRDAQGRDLGFEIRGVSGELLQKYSQRSEQRDQAIAAFTEKNGRSPSDNEVAILVRESRPDKLLEISTAAVRAGQRARLLPEEGPQLTHLRENALQAAPTRENSLSHEMAAPALTYAQQHLFERVSVASEHDLLTEALRHGRGQVSLAELQGRLQLEETQGAILRAGGELATRESLERERGMVSRIERGLGRFDRLGGENEFVASDRLRPEQKQVVELVLASRDLAVNLRGAAGTGKTATLAELHRGLAEGGRQVLALAPTRSAVEELQKAGFPDAITVERFLQDPREQAALRGQVLVVDEAGMLSGRQMAGLLKLAEQHAARIVFSGDTKQIQSVEASDALRVLEQESPLKSVSLTQVQRQTLASYREAIQELRRDPERGFGQLEQIGAIREMAWQERAQAVAAAYRHELRQSNAQGQPRQVLVVAPTHEEIERVTEAIRAERMRAGELGKSVQLERHVSLNWTTAQKSDPRRFRPGHILEFHRAVKGVAKNESLEVVRVEEGKIVARNVNGEELAFSGKQAKSFDVQERQTIEVAPHDKLLLTANRREPGFRATNGELVTVSGIDEQGRIRLEDGRTVPQNYRQFAHGYAVTAHRSQGKSVDAVLISGDAMPKELFYVAASRGRESITVFTSDTERLRESVARSSARTSALELERKAQAPTGEERDWGLRQGDYRGLAAARSLARQALQQELREHAMPLSSEQDLALRQREQQQEQKLKRGHGYGF